MSKKRWLIVPLCVVLCSQGSFAQTLTRKVLGINEMFRLADENSQSIQTYKTEKEVTDEALKAAKSQRLPDISASLSFSYLGDGYLWDRDFKNGQNIPMPHFGNNFALEAQQVIYQQQYYFSRTQSANGCAGLAEEPAGDTFSSDRLLPGFI